MAWGAYRQKGRGDAQVMNTSLDNTHNSERNRLLPGIPEQAQPRALQHIDLLRDQHDGHAVVAPPGLIDGGDRVVPEEKLLVADVCLRGIVRDPEPIRVDRC